MTRLLAFVSATLIGGAALMTHTLTKAPAPWSAPSVALPYYDSADLTPRWQPVTHRIDDFDLVTQTGEPLRRSDLIGRVHVATFIYTRCANVCPAMVTQLSKVQRAIQGRNDAAIVAFSVTPQHDPPQALAAFGAGRQIDPALWKLVTGDPEQIYALARASYFADDGRLDAGKPAAEQFLHTEKALLVDREGKLRGVYNATLPHEISKLLTDLNLLLDER